MAERMDETPSLPTGKNKFTLIEQCHVEGTNMNKRTFVVRDCNFRIQKAADESFYVHNESSIEAYTPSSLDHLQVEVDDIPKNLTWKDMENVVHNVESKFCNQHHHESFSFLGKPLSERNCCDSKAYHISQKDEYNAKRSKDERYASEHPHHIAIPHDSRSDIYRTESGEIALLPEVLDRKQWKSSVQYMEGVPYEKTKIDDSFILRNLHTGVEFKTVIPHAPGEKYRSVTFFSLSGEYYILNNQYTNRDIYTLQHLTFSEEHGYYTPDEAFILGFEKEDISTANGKGFIAICRRKGSFNCNHILHIFQ